MYPTSCHKRSEATRSNCYWNHGHEWSVSWHPLLQTVDLQSDLLLGLWKSGGDGGCSLGESPLRRRLPHTSSPSSPLTAAGQAGRLWPTATTQPLLLPATPPPRPPAGPLLRPSVPGTLGGSLWRPNGRRKMTRPVRLRTPSPNSVTWQPQRGAQCIPPRRPRAASPRALGDETSPAHYRRRRGLGAGRGRGAAAATRAHLFSGRRVEAEGEGRGRVSPGYVRRGAQPPRYVPALPQPC